MRLTLLCVVLVCFSLGVSVPVLKKRNADQQNTQQADLQSNPEPSTDNKEQSNDNNAPQDASETDAAKPNDVQSDENKEIKREDTKTSVDPDGSNNAPENPIDSQGKTANEEAEKDLEKSKKDAGNDVQENGNDVQENGNDVQDNGNDVQENADNVPDNGNDVQENADNVQENADNVQENADNVPENADNVPENADNVPENADNVQENADNVPENADNVPEKGDQDANQDDAKLSLDEAKLDEDEGKIDLNEEIPDEKNAKLVLDEVKLDEDIGNLDKEKPNEQDEQDGLEPGTENKELEDEDTETDYEQNVQNPDVSSRKKAGETKIYRKVNNNRQIDENAESSHFFAYLVCAVILVAILYIANHNKRKVVAFVVEGRKATGFRRPKTSGYQKLDQN